MILTTGAIVSGLLIPLGAGISEISPARALSGEEVKLHIRGYNTHFASASTNKVYLRSEDRLLCGRIQTIHGDGQMSVLFTLPDAAFMKNQKETYSLIITNEHDGTFFLRQCFTAEKSERNDSTHRIDTCDEKIKLAGAKSITFPYREILYESIRNLFFHVPMWFCMILLLLFSVAAAIRFLTTADIFYDTVSSSFAGIALFFGLMGILTGMQWAAYTWGAPWISDPKLNGAAVGLLIYVAYFILRGSLENEQLRARVAAVYSIFSFALFMVFIFVIPRLSDSLHPGSGGNPGFNTYDLDNTMRPVFYAAVIGFTGIGYWMASLWTRYRWLLQNSDEN